MSDHPTYTPDQGEAHYPGGQTVVIAGRPRQGISWCYPGIVDLYARLDRLAAEDEEARAERRKEWGVAPG